jgi:ATP synthase protein I
MSPEPNSHDRHPDHQPELNRKNEPKVGWLDRYAQRSAGLPDAQPPAAPREKSPWSYAGLGFQFAGTATLFALMGLYLDRRFGWSPWGTISLTMLGVIGGLYLLIKDALKRNRDQDRKP